MHKGKSQSASGGQILPLCGEGRGEPNPKQIPISKSQSIGSIGIYWDFGFIS
ncbi:hypothetical protein KAW65_05085 [candidate division WOR-3 bacterium]|nr:hypothetical protein [candidate division WOR-3 bacterium]